MRECSPFLLVYHLPTVSHPSPTTKQPYYFMITAFSNCYQHTNREFSTWNFKLAFHVFFTSAIIRRQWNIHSIKWALKFSKNSPRTLMYIVQFNEMSVFLGDGWLLCNLSLLTPRVLTVEVKWAVMLWLAQMSLFEAVRLTVWPPSQHHKCPQPKQITFSETWLQLSV